MLLPVGLPGPRLLPKGTSVLGPMFLTRGFVHGGLCPEGEGSQSRESLFRGVFVPRGSLFGGGLCRETPWNQKIRQCPSYWNAFLLLSIV